MKVTAELFKKKVIDDTLHAKDVEQGSKIRSAKVVVGLLAASLLLSGCASRVDQFKKFGEAGVVYSDTMNKLLSASGEVAIDADSAVLIEARSSLSSGYDGERDKRLEQHNKLLNKRLKILNDIAAHNQLLNGYFKALAELAGSNAGTEIATGTTGIFAELNKLNPRISQAKLGKAPIGSLVGPATELVVASFQQAALENELKRNAKTIERELELQVAAIKEVAEIWKTDQKIIVGGKDITNREEFLQDNNGLPRNWAENRKAILTVNNSVELADSACTAAKKLKMTFVKLVEKEVDVEDIPLLVNDLNKVLNLIDLVKNDPFSHRFI